MWSNKKLYIKNNKLTHVFSKSKINLYTTRGKVVRWKWKTKGPLKKYGKLEV